MRHKFVVIGGGLAGLCASIRLCELGEAPLLIEGGSYPTHKVCGEFLSPECIKYLEGWNIHPIPIVQGVLRTPTTSLVLPFHSPAGGLSHMQLDPALAKYAISCGATILTHTLVHSFKPKKELTDPHLITLSTGETLEASSVIIATGRIPNYSNTPPVISYMGFKAHFSHIPSQAATLEMFSLPGAYLGISPVEEGKYNVACLASLKRVGTIDPSVFIKNLISQEPYLSSLLSQGKNLFDQWMVASVPEFGLKQTPDWLDTYFIGDAAMTIPPASGSGLSMAIFSGRLAAEYSVRRQFEGFKKMSIKRCASQIFWAKWLHKLMLNPSYSNPVIRLSSYFPFVAQKIFEITRQSELGF
jgi:menaquinone-9 beta-reductase